MSSNYILTLEPTFTQGLVLGQLFILTLLALILRYLFLDSTKYPFETPSYHPRVDPESTSKRPHIFTLDSEEAHDGRSESAKWFNALMEQIMETYRNKLRDDLLDDAGLEIARRRIEDFANAQRPPTFIDHIQIHAIDLGTSAPRISNARVDLSDPKAGPKIECDLSYSDSVSVSLSTSCMFNYPIPSFARLPVSLTISLSQFKSTLIITPPSPLSPAPFLTLELSPNFTLSLKTTSLMGSRAKLANIPKLHELIEHQVRRIIVAKGKRHVVMPGIATVPEVKEEIKKEKENFDVN